MSAQSGLPTREQMFANALADLERARDAMSSCADWLRSDWRPVGTSLTNAQADARSATWGPLASAQREIEEALHALRWATGGTR